MDTQRNAQRRTGVSSQQRSYAQRSAAQRDYAPRSTAQRGYSSGAQSAATRTHPVTASRPAARPQMRRPQPARRSGGVIGWFRAQLAKRPKPVWMLVVMDILLIGISLVVFALFHHVLPRREVSTGIVFQRPTGTTTVEASSIEETVTLPETNEEPLIADEEPVIADIEEPVVETETQTETAAKTEPEAATEASESEAAIGTAVGDFSVINAGKFSTSAGQWVDNTYVSPNVNITLTTTDDGDVVYHVADIYIRDIAYFKTALAEDKYGRYRDWPKTIANNNNAIVAVNGDYYGARSDGIVIRNGELYRMEFAPSRDVLILYWDGTMKTFSPWEFNANREMEQGAYQAWNFGPELLDEFGQPMTEFNSDVNRANPRTAIGYYAPGHYCFVAVDGRSKASDGLTTKELSQLMYNLGCRVAYNMDGGNTSQMVANGELVNDPSGGGRKCSDIIMIVDEA